MIAVQLQSIELIREGFDLKQGLLKSELLPWAPIAIDSTEARREIATQAPIDGREIVEWMHYSSADIATFDAMCQEYNRLGSELLSGSGDAYIPGVRVGDLRGESVTGATVSARGYGTVVTPRGNFNVPAGGKATFAKGDILAWGAIPYVGSVQWTLTLLQWRDLAAAPIRDRVRFASSNGLVAPNFFSVTPRIPTPAAVLRIGLTSDVQQTVAIRGRGTRGSFEQILFEDSFNIKSGESEVVYTVFGFPFVSSFTLELAPSDKTNTILDYLEVLP